MTCHGDLIVWECARCLLDRRCYAISRVYPAVPEAMVRCASRADIRVDSVEVKVGDPCINGGTATESDNDQFVRVIDAYVTSNIGRSLFPGCYERLACVRNMLLACLPVELKYSRGICRFDLWAVSSSALDLTNCRVKIAGTVRRGSILSHQFECAQLVNWYSPLLWSEWCGFNARRAQQQESKERK